jgi:uncharacterized YccA/Bax inhibitor family protein
MLRRFSGGNPFIERGIQSSTATTGYGSSAAAVEGTMTKQGAINKTITLFVLLLITAVIGYQFPVPFLIIGCAIVALILVIVSAFKPNLAPTIAPLYALLQGVFVGGVSAMYAHLGGGIILQAVSLTILVLMIMLVIQKTGLIPVTAKFRMGVVMATGAIMLLYLASFVLRFFGITIPFIHEGGTFGILFSLAVIGIASLNLLLDFDNIIKGEEYGAPKYMEWFTAMGLMITLIWLYFEILRLLAKTRE